MVSSMVERNSARNLSFSYTSEHSQYILHKLQKSPFLSLTFHFESAPILTVSFEEIEFDAPSSISARFYFGNFVLMHESMFSLV